jgi:hypothetical protein
MSIDKSEPRANEFPQSLSSLHSQLIPVSGKAPPVHQRVIVVCKGFRCLGYIDKEGVWRDAKGKVFEDVIGWFEC